MAEAAQTLPHPMRRLMAYWIDKVCAWLLFGLLITLFGLDPYDDLVVLPEKGLSAGFNLGVDTTKWRPLVTVGTKTCGAPSEAARQMAAAVVNGQTSQGRICIERIFGVFVGGSYSMTVTTADGQTEKGALPLVPTDRPFTLADHLAALLMCVAGWLCLAATRRTPGKWLMGLKVTGTPLAKLAREVIRLSPVLAMLVLNLVNQVLVLQVPQLDNGTASWLVFGVSLIVPIGLWLWLWLVPLARDNPYVPWDRWTGCRLTHANEEPLPDLPF